MSTCDASAVVRGVGKSRMHAPHHHFHIQLKLATGIFPEAVCKTLLVKGVDFFMVNDVVVVEAIQRS